jgi:hypothetical protein
MVAEFVTEYHMTFQQVYDMPSQMFFIYYREVPAIRAQRIVDSMKANELVAAMQWSDDRNKRKVEREIKKIENISEGNY